MIISTSSHTVQLTDEIDVFANDTLHSDLERLNDDIVSIDVFLNDVNAPKAGGDIQAIIRVGLRNRRQITIEAVKENVTAAIRRGSKRVKRAVWWSTRKSRRIRKLRPHKKLHDDA